MCLTNLQTSVPHLPPDRSASPAPGGPATVPGQERAGKAEGAGEARPGPWTETRERSLRARALRPGPRAPCPAAACAPGGGGAMGLDSRSQGWASGERKVAPRGGCHREEACTLGVAGVR